MDDCTEINCIYRFVDKLTVVDKENKLESEVNFLPGLSEKTGGFFNKKKREIFPKDINRVEIMIKKNGKEVSKGK